MSPNAESSEEREIADGPGACREPYDAPHFFNISGMSYGALSHAAVTARHGARGDD